MSCYLFKKTQNLDYAYDSSWNVAKSKCSVSFTEGRHSLKVPTDLPGTQWFSSNRVPFYALVVIPKPFTLQIRFCIRLLKRYHSIPHLLLLNRCNLTKSLPRSPCCCMTGIANQNGDKIWRFNRLIIALSRSSMPRWRDLAEACDPHD